MITNTKFSYCPTIFKIGTVQQLNMHSKQKKIRFKAIHHVHYRENVHFLLPPLILRIYTGCRLDQTLRKCISSLKNKSAKMLKI